MLTAEQILKLIEQQKAIFENRRDSDKSLIDSIKASKHIDDSDEILLKLTNKSYIENYNRAFALDWLLDLINADGDITKLNTNEEES